MPVFVSTGGGGEEPGAPNDGWIKKGTERDHVLGIIKTLFVFRACVTDKRGRRHRAPRRIIKSYSGCKSEMFF